jgi:hypothetical protein
MHLSEIWKRIVSNIVSMHLLLWKEELLRAIQTTAKHKLPLSSLLQQKHSHSNEPLNYQFKCPNMTINYHSNTIRILFVRNRDSKNCYNIIFHWSWEKAKVDHVRQNRCVDWASLTWRNKIYSNFNKVTLDIRSEYDETRRINALLT